MQDDPAFAREALRGARGYVLKHAADTDLVEAVRSAAVGQTYLHPELGREARRRAAGARGPPDDLTEREVEVLRLLALGHTNTEVAAQLYLSVRTVESHRAHIQHKVRRSTRAELVSYAREQGARGALSRAGGSRQRRSHARSQPGGRGLDGQLAAQRSPHARASR